MHEKINSLRVIKTKSSVKIAKSLATTLQHSSYTEEFTLAQDLQYIFTSHSSLDTGCTVIDLGILGYLVFSR